MPQEVNCYTLRARSPEEGTVFETPSLDFLAFPIGDGEGVKVRIPSGGTGVLYPHTAQGSRLMSVAAIEQTGQANGIRHDWPGILIRIIARELDFGLAPLAPQIRIWAGGEGLRPVVRQGNMSDPSARDELFVLEEGQRMVVADRRNCLMNLVCENGKPLMSPMTHAEAVLWLVRYCTHVDRADGVAWGVRTLDQLGEPAAADPFRDRPSHQAGRKGRVRARSRVRYQ